MPDNNTVNTSMENREWDSAKLKAYFEDCRKVYNDFLEMSDSLINAFQAFVDDEGLSRQDDTAVGTTQPPSRGDRYLGHSSRHTQVPVPVTKSSD